MPSDRVVEQRRRQHVRITVPVQVRRVYGHRTQRIRGNRAARGERPTAQVFVPTDRVIQQRCRENVRIAIPIQVGGIYVPRSVRGRRYGLPLGERSAAEVFVPVQRIVEVGGVQHVRVAVPVQVRRVHRGGAAHAGRDRARCGQPEADVLMPVHRAVGVGGAQHVRVAVPVQVRRMHVPRTRPELHTGVRRARHGQRIERRARPNRGGQRPGIRRRHRSGNIAHHRERAVGGAQPRSASI